MPMAIRGPFVCASRTSGPRGWPRASRGVRVIPFLIPVRIQHRGSRTVKSERRHANAAITDASEDTGAVRVCLKNKWAAWLARQCLPCGVRVIPF
jgi:hypothetical protein